jgi:hypothetical protein
VCHAARRPPASGLGAARQRLHATAGRGASTGRRHATAARDGGARRRLHATADAPVASAKPRRHARGDPRATIQSHCNHLTVPQSSLDAGFCGPVASERCRAG